jgi:pimeloyl-ACP methyl ester carboxylesterase
MKIVNTKTSDGFHFSGLLSEPSGERKGIILHIHGMAGSIYMNSFYTEMHETFPQNGYAFLTGELRGTSTIQEFITDRGEEICGNAYEKFEDCIIDIQAWVDFAQTLGYSKIWLQGHSLGTSKITYYVAQTKSPIIEGLLLISPSDMLGLVHDPDGILDHQILFPEAQSLVGEGKGDMILTHSLWGCLKLSAQTYLNFFSNTSNTAIFNFNSLGLGWKVVNSLTVPVLAFTGSHDDGIVPVMEAHQAMSVFERELSLSERVKTVVYEGAGHGFDGFEKNIVEDVLEFIEK